MRQFGVDSSQPFPQIAFNMLDSRVLTYPHDNVITKDEVMKWLDDAFLGKVQASYKKKSVIVDT